jgi:hypothetical protein
MKLKPGYSLPSSVDDDPTSIAVRAFVRTAKAGKSKSRGPRTRTSIKPSNVVLVFDTETDLDEAQHLRFGTYQVYVDSKLDEQGLFYDPNTISKKDLRVLHRYAMRNDLKCRALEDYISTVFYGIGYDLGATIVGFNLPFDISRIAWHYSTAKTPSMSEGFSFALSHDSRRGRVQVKMLSGSAPSIRFATPEHRFRRRRGNEVPPSQGYFVDIRALAAALTNRSFSLKKLADFLETTHRKLSSDVLEGPLTDETIEYAVRDTLVTWECFAKLRDRYAAHGLAGTEIQNIHSVASMGKAYFREIGILPLAVTQPNIPHALIGNIMSAYYGGRSEVHLRRTVSQVLYCDFLSMYPTVCTLMNLWRFIIAQGMTWTDTTEHTAAFLDAVTLADLKKQETWKTLLVLVRVQPEGDIFPVRAKYGVKQDASYTIGQNYLTLKEPLWFTLADCIASKLRTDKPPIVLEAITFAPGLLQPNLKPIAIAGNPDYLIDPVRDDLFKRLIQLRIEIKRKMKGTKAQVHHALDVAQEFLKTLANSAAYGISVQIDPADFDKRESIDVFGPRARPHRIFSKRYETPGPYFHPLLGAVTTSAARLMLAITERLILDEGLDWAFCDTDSMAIAKPDGMSDAGFSASVERIRGWFAPLNPYGSGESLLKLEDANFNLRKPGELEPLYCYTISSKRYALFNLDAKGRPILRKASAHGLGHLRSPTDA